MAGRKEGARSNRHRIDIENMREVITSTLAIEPRSLRYNETTAESSESTDASDYSYDTEESENNFQGFPQVDQEHTRDRQTAQTRENPQAEINHNRDDSDYEWEELQVTQFPGEDENLLRMWEGLLDESRACRIWVKKSIIEILEKFNNYILEVERHPEEIKIKKKKTKGELYEMEHEVDWLKNRARECINEDTEIPFGWL